MKKLMLALAACAAFVSVASANDAWFTGTIGSEAGGTWTVPADGVTTNGTTLVLDGVESELTFAVTNGNERTLSSSANLIFESSATFQTAYDELPEIPSGAKAGVIAYEGATSTNYYVLAKDSTTNKWVDTEIAATLDSAVAVDITISNGTSSAVFAYYKFGDNVICKEVAASGTWGQVSYLGSGEVASLVGTTAANISGWDSPSGKIVVDTAWATANGIDAAAFASADKLSNGFSASESYVLGLNTNESLTISTGFKGEYITVSVDQPANVADKVTYDVWIDGASSLEGATTFPTNCFTRSAAGTNERTIEVRPNVTGQNTTGTSQTIGIWASNAIGTNSTGYVTIPYECAVSNAMYTLFNDGDDWDYMYVLDPTSGEWDTWQIWSSGNTWTYVPTDSRDTPITTVLRPGQAVKVSVGVHKYGADKRFYRCGNKVDRSKTTLVAGCYNLVGNPAGTAFLTSKLDNSAKIKLKSGTDILPNTSYFKYGQKWYRQPLNGTAVEKTEVEAADVNGFFLNSPATSIEW